jgi:hypothetical protein
MMLPTNIYQLVAFLSGAILTLLAFLKAYKWYIDGEIDKQKSKDQLEIAKYKDNVFTAAQVMDLMKATDEVKKDVAQIKADNENRDQELTRAMDKLENNLRNFEDMFQKFLIARVNQFEQTLLK